MQSTSSQSTRTACRAPESLAEHRKSKWHPLAPTSDALPATGLFCACVDRVHRHTLGRAIGEEAAPGPCGILPHSEYNPWCSYVRCPANSKNVRASITSDSVVLSLLYRRLGVSGGHRWGAVLQWPKVRSHAMTHPLSLLDPLRRCPIQPGVRYPINYSISCFVL